VFTISTSTPRTILEKQAAPGEHVIKNGHKPQ
jgi:hypothetical protein